MNMIKNLSNASKLLLFILFSLGIVIINRLLSKDVGLVDDYDDSTPNLNLGNQALSASHDISPLSFDSPVSDDYFMATLPGTWAAEGTMIVEANDGSLIALGGIPWLRELFVVKLDMEGATKWLYKISAGPHHSDAIPTSLTLTNDGGVFTVMRKFNSIRRRCDNPCGNRLIWSLVTTKLTSSGSVVWAYDYRMDSFSIPKKTFVLSYSGNTLLVMIHVIRYSTPQGHLIFLNEDTGSRIRDRYMGSHVLPYAADEMSDGNLTVVGKLGSDHSISIGDDLFLTKLDPNGKILWFKALNLVGNEAAYAVVASSNDTLFVSGVKSNDLYTTDSFLAKFSSLGDVIWFKLYQAGSKTTTVFSSLEILPDFGYLLGAKSNGFGTGSLDALALKLSPSGEVEWTKKFGTIHDDSTPTVIYTSSSNQFFIGGTFNTANAPSSQPPTFFVSSFTNMTNYQRSCSIRDSYGPRGESYATIRNAEALSIEELTVNTTNYIMVFASYYIWSRSHLSISTETIHETITLVDCFSSLPSYNNTSTSLILYSDLTANGNLQAPGETLWYWMNITRPPTADHLPRLILEGSSNPANSLENATLLALYNGDGNLVRLLRNLSLNATTLTSDTTALTMPTHSGLYYVSVGSSSSSTGSFQLTLDLDSEVEGLSLLLGFIIGGAGVLVCGLLFCNSEKGRSCRENCNNDYSSRGHVWPRDRH